MSHSHSSNRTSSALWWAIAIGLFFFLLWRLGNVLMPFLVGFALAYFLDPVADWLEKKGLSRILSVTIITVISIGLLIAFALIVIPTLIGQLAALFEAMPGILAALQGYLEQRFPEAMAENGVLREQIERLGVLLSENGGQLVESLINSAKSVVNVFVFLMIVPVVTFYMLVDWDRMTEIINALLPRSHAYTVRTLATRIDLTLSSFVRGQFMVCLILGVFYSVCLSLAGLNYGLIVGAIGGALTFIPYFGAFIGGALAIGLAIFQFWGDWGQILLIAAIFFAGQFLEGNIITPNLVGSSVALHPVWLLLAISVFGALFGFTGMLIAVPVAAVMGVVVRYMVDEYRQSDLYLGTDTDGT